MEERLEEIKDKYMQQEYDYNLKSTDIDWLIEQAGKVPLYEREIKRLYEARYSEMSDIAKETFGLKEQTP